MRESHEKRAQRNSCLANLEDWVAAQAQRIQSDTGAYLPDMLFLEKLQRQSALESELSLPFLLSLTRIVIEAVRLFHQQNAVGSK